MAASAGATRRAGCIAWYLAWTRCAITDSPLGLSFWKKVCFIQRPRTGSSAQPATIPSRGLQRPRSTHAAVLGSGVGSLPSYLCGHFAPRRTNQSIPFLHPCSFPASCLEPLVMLVELCLALSVPASIRPVVGVGASPRRWSQIPGQWEAADGMGGSSSCSIGLRANSPSSRQCGAAQETWPRDLHFHSFRKGDGAGGNAMTNIAIHVSLSHGAAQFSSPSCCRLSHGMCYAPAAPPGRFLQA